MKPGTDLRRAELCSTESSPGRSPCSPERNIRWRQKQEATRYRGIAWRHIPSL
jgi:hypothetical protein